MTTIAYRDGEMAADAMMTCGNTHVGSMVKIAKREDGALIGGVGNASWCHAFMKWAKEPEGECPTIPLRDGDAEAQGVIVEPDGVVWIYEAGGRFPVDGPYHAWGSGQDFALGAMFLGAGVISAVDAAIHHDASSGGRITVLKSGE